SSSDTEIAALKAKMAEINKNLMRVLQVNQKVKTVTPNCETCGGPHSFSDCPASVGETQNVYAARAYQGNSYQPQGNRNLLSYRSESYLGPPGFNQNHNRNNQNHNFQNQNRNQGNHNPQGNNQGRSQFFQGANQGQTLPPAYQVPAYQAPSYQALVHQPQIPQPQVVTTNEFTNLRKENDAILKNMQTNMTSLTNSNLELKKCSDLNFNISFADALILMPKFGPYIKRLLTNKDKLFELSRTPLDEHCSAVLQKKFPEKLGDPGKFLIQGDFLRMAECLAMAYLDFVVVDFDADPRVPLILGRYFLKTKRALIDVFEGELTLRVGKEAMTFNLDQTLRYSANYNDMTANRIDIIDMACEEYSKEVLGFSNVITSGNPTPYYDPIVSTTSPTLTPFGNSDFFLEEVDAFLALEDDPTSPEVDQSSVNTEGDILLLESFLNDDPSLPPPNQGNYLPQDLPPHLEYTFLEVEDKLPVIIVKDLSVEEKTALITNGIRVDKAKVDVIAKLPHPTTVKDSPANDPSSRERYPFLFSKECVEAFQTLKRKLTKASILIVPDWDLPFELMCDVSDFAIDAVLGQRQEKHFRPIHYASKTMTEAESNYTITEKEMLAVVYLFAKKDSKARLLRWVLLHQEFSFKVIDTKGAENLAVDHLS
nr:reverse transcriptase domain-containing protein [Tanacetum cinerariifolium]